MIGALKQLKILQSIMVFSKSVLFKRKKLDVGNTSKFRAKKVSPL